MVQSPIGGMVSSTCALAACFFFPAQARVGLTPEQVNQPRAPDFSPPYAGHTVLVAGVVSARPFRFPGYTLLAFEQDRHGPAIEVREGDRDIGNYQPGDEIQDQGPISSRAGMVVVAAARIRRLGNKPAPSPEPVPVDELMGFHHPAQFVRTKGQLVELGDTTAGAYLLVSAKGGNYKFFIPHASDVPSAEPSGVRLGDTIQAKGVAFQYRPVPPHDRWFELLAGNPNDIVALERRWVVPPLAVTSGVGVALLIGLILWSRERRLRGQRERLRRVFQLGEEILGASSLDTILDQTTKALPGILGVTRVHLYVFNRGTKALDAVVPEGQAALSISLSSPPGGTRAGAVACFHYRTLLVIPDVERSPFPIASGEPMGSPKSLLFVPMLSQGEVLGVLELDQDDRVRDFTGDEQALAQHLGNQIGVAIRLLDQRSVQEQLFRTEKLAAVGRLISGVVNELQAPLASISELAGRAVDKGQATPAERELSAIAAESHKASAIVARLVSFGATEQVEARPVDISMLLRNLIEFRERDWKASGIRVRDLTLREPVFVLGSYGQLEQAFLTLLIHAEQSLARAEQKTLTIRTGVLAKRLLVEVAFTAPPDARTPQETAAVLGVTRGVVTGHGGEVRLIEKDNAEPTFEVELPVTAKERLGAVAPAPPRESAHPMTALVIEPEDAAQRQLLALLVARGFRVVPVENADKGLELAHRMRFDAAFCSVHAPGLNWVELSERMHSRVDGFILLSDGCDTELSADFAGDGRFVVSKPVQEADLERVLKAIEFPVAAKHPVG